MGPYPAFCLQRELNGFVGLVGVEGGKEERREKGAGGESKKGRAYPRAASEAVHSHLPWGSGGHVWTGRPERSSEKGESGGTPGRVEWE